MLIYVYFLTEVAKRNLLQGLIRQGMTKICVFILQHLKLGQIRLVLIGKNNYRDWVQIKEITAQKAVASPKYTAPLNYF